MADVVADRFANTDSTDYLVDRAPEVAPIDRPKSAKIGPNAILQLIAVLREERHERWLRDVFYRSGLSAMLVNPPDEMVDERVVADLYLALFERLPPAAANRIAGKAGRRTARYILANRIPKPVKVLLKLLPARWSAPLLLCAIERHAWTFAGSGETHIVKGPSPTVEIANNPIAMPGCVWHVQVFETLFQRLISPGAMVRHTACCRDGAPSCRFDIMLPARPVLHRR